MDTEPADFAIEPTDGEIDFHSIPDQGQVDPDLERAMKLMELQKRGEL
jgi:hypothetical protein